MSSPRSTLARAVVLPILLALSLAACSTGKRIIAMCGKNAASKFRGQHGTGGRANSTMKKYKIGVLA